MIVFCDPNGALRKWMFDRLVLDNGCVVDAYDIMMGFYAKFPSGIEDAREQISCSGIFEILRMTIRGTKEVLQPSGIPSRMISGVRWKLLEHCTFSTNLGSRVSHASLAFTARIPGTIPHKRRY